MSQDKGIVSRNGMSKEAFLVKIGDGYIQTNGRSEK